jgi:hypothetical protein
MSPPHRPPTRLAVRLRFPGWAAHPAIGVLALVVVAVLLIAYGEPQPSSRPSGTSVVVSGTPSQPVAKPSLLTIRLDHLEVQTASGSRSLRLPDHVVPHSVMTSHGLSVVLGTVSDHQYAYAILRNLQIVSLGPADAVIPAESAGAAIIIETALSDPGRLPELSVPPSSSDPAADLLTGRKKPSGPPELGDYVVRRYDSAARTVGQPIALPIGMRLGADTSVGMALWQPAGRFIDNGVALEPLSAEAVLMRPDGTTRQLGPVFPLAANGQQLLVWGVSRHAFGLMPLEYVTSTATTTATSSTSASESPASSRSSIGQSPVVNAAATSTPDRSPTASATPSTSPTAVAGTVWFDSTKGISVTGPGAFAPDGSAFAVYAQVGNRRRLVVGQVTTGAHNQVEVLALSPLLGPTDADSATASGGSGKPSPAARSTSTARSSATSTVSGSPTASEPAYALDGYPVPAPLTPMWLSEVVVVGLGNDGTVVSYRPGGHQATPLDLGATDYTSLAPAP